MREILFKAKRLDNGEWIEGYYCQLPKMSLGATIIANGEACAEDTTDYIIEIIYKQHSSFSNAFPLAIYEYELHEINPLTICQYIGLNDKNGKKIFEGDLLEYCGDCYIVEFLNGNFCCPEFYELQTKFPWNMLPEGTDEVEVVGNIHDEVEG